MQITTYKGFYLIDDLSKPLVDRNVYYLPPGTYQVKEIDHPRFPEAKCYVMTDGSGAAAKIPDGCGNTVLNWDWASEPVVNAT